MEFGEVKRNTSNWSNFCMLPRRAGLTASAGLSCNVINSGCFYYAFGNRVLQCLLSVQRQTTKKAVLSQRWPRDARYTSGSNKPLRRYGHSRILGHMEPHLGERGGHFWLSSQ